MNNKSFKTQVIELWWWISIAVFWGIAVSSVVFINALVGERFGMTGVIVYSVIIIPTMTSGVMHYIRELIIRQYIKGVYGKRE